ncbi:MAG: signal peptide peptidase SppA [Thermodesulfobacteriota bacterium]
MFSRRHPYLFFILVFTAIVSGMFVTMTMLIVGVQKSPSFAGDTVGIVEIEGVIMESKDTVRQLKEYREDESIKAIVLRIDSPGGAVGPSQEIYREVRKTIEKKKVIASMGSVAASGGYYIAAASDGIVANPGTITGSIGVIMGYTNFREIFQKIGLLPIVIKSGEYKDIGSPLREMTAPEKEILQKFVDTIHRQFVQDVSLGRKMDPLQMGKLADGRIFSGEEAKMLGLVDRTGNFEDAVEWAGRLGGIKGKISTVYPEEKPLSFLQYLTESSLDSLFSRLSRSDIAAEYRYEPRP